MCYLQILKDELTRLHNNVECPFFPVSIGLLRFFASFPSESLPL